MKEYKVISPSLGIRKRSEKLEVTFNKYAKKNLTINAINNNKHSERCNFVLEHEKN